MYTRDDNDREKLEKVRKGDIVELRVGDRVLGRVHKDDLFSKVDSPQPLGKQMDMDLYK